MFVCVYLRILAFYPSLAFLLFCCLSLLLSFFLPLFLFSSVLLSVFLIFLFPPLFLFFCNTVSLSCFTYFLLCVSTVRFLPCFGTASEIRCSVPRTPVISVCFFLSISCLFLFLAFLTYISFISVILAWLLVPFVIISWCFSIVGCVCS